MYTSDDTLHIKGKWELTTTADDAKAAQTWKSLAES